MGIISKRHTTHREDNGELKRESLQSVLIMGPRCDEFSAFCIVLCIVSLTADMMRLRFKIWDLIVYICYGSVLLFADIHPIPCLVCLNQAATLQWLPRLARETNAQRSIQRRLRSNAY